MGHLLCKHMGHTHTPLCSKGKASSEDHMYEVVS